MISTNYLFGQIASKSNFVRESKFDIDIPVYVLPEVDLKKLEREDRKFNSTGLKAMRFAKVISVDIDPLYDGLWVEEDSGNKKWFIKLKSPGAYSLSILFDQYRLPIGAELFVYSNDRNDVRGAFTYKNNKSNSILAIAPVKGDEIVIEYHEPKEVSFKGELHISSVAHDYKNVIDILYKNEKAYGGSGSCNVNVNCENDELWQRIKHSVCKITYNGWLCSGALINNTNNDGTPYFLTANHCIDNSFDASSAIFYFNYESPTCINENGPVDQTISGSTIIATPSVKSLDFTLLKLSANPPANYNPYFAGWNRDVADPESVTSIHHPSGDIKKITKSYDGATTGDYGEGYTEFSHWYIDAWDKGTTEGGSSGAPLFDQNGRIIGDLTGGDASCTFNYNDYFQQFYRSWNEFSKTNEQLKIWLDPLNSDQIFMDGYLPYDSIPTKLKASITDTLIHLSWNVPVDFSNVKRYIIYRDSVKLDSTTNNYYTDISAYKDSVYLYWVTARLKNPLNKESSPSNSIYIRTMDSISTPFVETFEGLDTIPKGWYEERSDKNVGWRFKKGGLDEILDTAYEGVVNAYFFGGYGEISKLVLPRFNFDGNTNSILEFYVIMTELNNDIHELRVLVKEADSLDWKVVRTYNKEIPNWSFEHIPLPGLSSNYQIAFEGIGLRGGGICIDSISIKEDTKYIEPDIIINKDVICIYDSVEFTTSLDNTFKLEWDFGETAVPRFAIGKGPHKVKYTSVGIKGAQLTLDDTYLKDENDLVHVYINSEPDFIIKGDKLVSSSSYGNQWYYNGKIILNATNQSYTYDKEGYYYVEVTNSFNCTGVSPEKYILVSDIVNLKEFEEQKQILEIYPNPNQGVFSLNIDDDLLRNLIYKIVDMTGKIIQTGELDSNHKTIILDNVVDGIYFIQVVSDNKQYTSKILIKK